MIETVKPAANEALDNFYSKDFSFSYSSLNKLLYSAQLFYNWYILKERQDSLESYLIEGKAIHCLLLDKEMFNDQFIVMPGNLPGVSNKKITEAMYKSWKEAEEEEDKVLSDYTDEILEWLVENDLHQKLKDDKDLTKADARTGDQKRLDKILDDLSKEYFVYLKKSKNKDVMNEESLARCEEAVEVLRNHKSVPELLRLNSSEFELIDVYNEKMLNCKLKSYPFGLKGIVDNYVIDHSKKKVCINDLKTTGKTISEFKDTVEYYKYWLQGAIYTVLVKYNHPETKDYEFNLNFIVIDKYNQVYPFPVTHKSMLEWHSQLEEVLEIAKYHYTNKDYTLPYEFALDQVTL